MDAVTGFDAAVFRRVIGNFMSGVVILTTVDDDIAYGMTVSAVCSLSLDPPMLVVCLHSGSATQEAVRRSGRFAVNILAEHQGALADRFARPGPAGKFEGLTITYGRTGLPLLAEALATVECRVADMVAGGTHRVFLAEAEEVHADEMGGAPLAYFRGRFGRFELAQDAETYRRVRRMVLDRRIAVGEAIEVEALAARLEVPASSAFYALTRLIGEKLVRRDERLGHVVTPLDVAASDDAHDAKLAIELGAADLVVGRLSAGRLAEMRKRAEVAAAQVRDGRFVDVNAYIGANHAFHRLLVDATGVRALAEAYGELSLPEMMARALPADVAADPRLTGDHFALVDALERNDLPAVKRVLTAHTDRAKQTQRAGILRHGGRL